MNATTRPRPAAPTAISKSGAKAPRTQPAVAPDTGRPDMTRTMDPKEFPKLEEALRDAISALYLAQAGMELLDDDEPKGLTFIVDGLNRHLSLMEELLEKAEKAAHAIAPRLNDEAATWLVVKKLAKECRHEIAEADLSPLVRAYQLEADAADPKTSCSTLFDRALRRMKSEAP